MSQVNEAAESRKRVDGRVTEFALQVGHDFYGNPWFCLRKRTATSAQNLGLVAHKNPTLSVSDFEDVMAWFERVVREFVVVTGGLQLTLPGL